MRISDWSSDVCSSDLQRITPFDGVEHLVVLGHIERDALLGAQRLAHVAPSLVLAHVVDDVEEREEEGVAGDGSDGAVQGAVPQRATAEIGGGDHLGRQASSEEKTSAIQELMRI